MIRFDDLLAARLLHRSRPELRPALVEALAAVDAASGGGASLLGSLVAGGVVGREEADALAAQVERWKRWRAAGIYARLLVEKAGLGEAVVSGLVRALGEAADRDRLGEAALVRGLLDRDAETRLRFQAKLACDWDLGQQVEAYRARGAGGPAPAASAAERGTGSGSSTGSDLGGLPSSGVFKVGPEVAAPAEVTMLFDRASTTLSRADALPPPRFPVPDWIDTHHPLAGRCVGKFRIIGKIGAGAMATVYLADEGDRTRPCALKLVPPEAGVERAARFRREILANSFFSHEGVIDVYDAGVAEDGHQYLAMEFFEGHDLDHLLEAEGTLSLQQALRVARQVARALEAAHEAGIVHRDVKPSNILVSKDGATAKLMDFGLALIRDLGEFKAKVFESDGGGVTGTPEYLSPEQACRDPLGPASDLYALGLVLYRCLAGRSPFAARTPGGWVQAHIHKAPLPLGEAAPGIAWPPALLELLDGLLVKDPARRIGAAGTVVACIDAIADGLGAPRRRQGPVARGP